MQMIYIFRETHEVTQMKKLYVISLSILSFIFFLSPVSGYAFSINVNEVIYQPDSSLDPLSLSGTVEFFTDSTYDLVIQLTNTSPDLSPSEFPSAVVLSGLALNLPTGVDIFGGAMLDDGNWHSGGNQPSDVWGYDNNVSTGPFANETYYTYNSSISTLSAAVTTSFGSGAPSVAGPDGGILSANETEMPPIGWNYYRGYAQIGLNLTDSWTVAALASYVNANGGAVLSFGSPTATTIPEPSTILLLGSGLIGLMGFSRRLVKK